MGEREGGEQELKTIKNDGRVEILEMGWSETDRRILELSGAHGGITWEALVIIIVL